MKPYVNPVHCTNVAVRREKFTRRDTVLGKNKVTATVKVAAETKTYLHIGRGKDYTVERLEEIAREINPGQLRDIDKLVQRIKGIEAGRLTRLAVEKHGSTPYIPGTSLKGAARSRIELLLSSNRGENISCFVTRSKPCRTLYPNRLMRRHIAIWGETTGENREPCRLPKKIEYLEDIEVCRICDIFGAAGLSGRVYFGSLFPDGEKPFIEVLEAVVRRGTGYTWVEVEAVPPGRMFRGEVAVHGLSMDELGLLAIAMRLNEDRPILIGRYKYSWLGVRVEGRVGTVPFGQLNIRVEEIRFPPYASAFLGSHGYRYAEEGASLVLRGEAAERLIEDAVRAAVEEHGPYLRRYLEGFDEVREVERLHGR